MSDLICFLAGGENFVALDLIVQHVHSQLEKVRIPNELSSFLCFTDSAQSPVSLRYFSTFFCLICDDVVYLKSAASAARPD